MYLARPTVRFWGAHAAFIAPEQTVASYIPEVIRRVGSDSGGSCLMAGRLKIIVEVSSH